MSKGEYVLVFTGKDDPMWSFLLEKCSPEEVNRIVRLTTDCPRSNGCSYNPCAGSVEFLIGNRTISAHEIRAIWWRRTVPPEFSGLSTDLALYCTKEYQSFWEGLEYTLPDVTWVSRPSAISRARNKGWQLQLAKAIGFQVPKTVFTNVPRTAAVIVEEAQMIYKSILSPRVPVNDSKHSTVFTTVLGEKHRQMLDGLVTCPGILQEFCDKASDIRVNVFGERVFAAEIKSQLGDTSKIDFRAGARHLPHLRHELPSTETNKCREIVSQLGLKFGAIDLALMDDGSYVFFEVNANGQWGWIEEKTQAPLRRALLDILFS